MIIFKPFLQYNKETDIRQMFSMFLISELKQNQPNISILRMIQMQRLFIDITHFKMHVIVVSRTIVLYIKCVCCQMYKWNENSLHCVL